MFQGAAYCLPLGSEHCDCTVSHKYFRSGCHARTFNLRSVDAGACRHSGHLSDRCRTAALCAHPLPASSEDAHQEPPQIYGSNQIELSWTVIPVLIVVMLFLATARVILGTQAMPKPKDALECDRHRPSVLVGVPLSQTRHRHRQRTPYSRQQILPTPLRLISTCPRRIPTTASGCRASPARWT